MSGGIILYERKIRYNRTLTGFIKLLFPTLLRFRGWRTVDVEGSLPDAGPLLISAHHESDADVLIIMSRIRRRLFWVADNRPFGKSLADTRIIKWFVAKTGMIAIDKRRPERNIDLMDHLLFHVEQGEAILFFPEGGTRSDRAGRQFGEFKNGVVRLAAYCDGKRGEQVPIYPMGVRYRGAGRSGHARLAIGEPIFMGETVEATHEALTERIKELSTWPQGVSA